MEMRFLVSIQIPFQEDEKIYVVTVILGSGTAYSLGPMTEEAKDALLAKLKDEQSLERLYKIWKKQIKDYDDKANEDKKHADKANKDKERDNEKSNDCFKLLDEILNEILTVMKNVEYNINNKPKM